VFFDDVRVPVENASARRTVAGTTPNPARQTSAPASHASARRRRASGALRDRSARAHRRHAVIEDERFRMKIAAVEVELRRSN